MSGTQSEAEGDVATELVLSYELVDAESGAWGTPNSNWIEKQLTNRSFRKQLLRSRAGPVTSGEEWEELLPCGCEKPMDVVLRVEAVHGGERFDESTEITVQPV